LRGSLRPSTGVTRLTNLAPKGKIVKSYATHAAGLDDGRRVVEKGRPRIEDRAHTIEARKPWLKLNMCRRTWYRRQAEKRKGRE
jgi:hypothetical protein